MEHKIKSFNNCIHDIDWNARICKYSLYSIELMHVIVENEKH